MIDVYSTWVSDRLRHRRLPDRHGQHVNNQFWQEWAPALVQHAANEDRQLLHVRRGLRLRSGFTSPHTPARAILDFPLPTQGRSFASRAPAATWKRSADDDYYDAGLEHHSCRFSVRHGPDRQLPPPTDNAGAADAGCWRATSSPALMYLSRGCQSIYYGDEQGYRASEGDKDRRMTMFQARSARLTTTTT